MRGAALPRDEEVTSERFYVRYAAQLWRPSLPLLVVHQWYEEGEDTGAFRHEDFFAFYVVQGGRGIHVIDGQPHAVTRGDVYATPPGAVHRYRDYHHLRAEALCFQAQLFCADELDALRTAPGFWDLLLPGGAARSAGAPHYQLHLTPERHREVEARMAEIFEEMARPDALPALVRGLLFRLLVYLARAHDAWQAAQKRPLLPAVSSGRAGGPAVADLLRVCEEHVAEPLSVPQLAGLLFLSPGHFSELFSREVGMPPAAYIRRLRLERAQTLLRTTDLSITAIAHDTGFGDSAVFSRTFRAVLGATPTAYRAATAPEYHTFLCPGRCAPPRGDYLTLSTTPRDLQRPRI